MKIVVNGDTQTIGERTSLTVAELLTLHRVESPDTVAVQLNGDFVPREHHATTAVHDGDTVDFLYFLGGGAP